MSDSTNASKANITIRRLTDSDTDVQLFRELSIWYQLDDDEEPIIPTNEYLQGLLNRDDFYVVVALDNNKVVAGITAYELPMYKEMTKELFVYEVATHEDYRRQGIMRRIFEHTQSIARNNGVSQLFVDADGDNDVAVKFYSAIGGQALNAIEFTIVLDSDKEEHK